MTLPEFDEPISRANYYRACLQILATWVSDDGYVGPAPSVPGTNRQQRRLTHQYISAMLRAGFPRNTRELERARDWLLRTSDSGSATDGPEYYVVPDKIEAAIEMGESDSDFCRVATDLLLKRRGANARSYTIPGETPNPFIALWAAKIFAQFQRSECRAAVDEILVDFSNHYHTLHARDLALLIHLNFKYGRQRSLRAEPLRSMLATLTTNCTGGFFDVNAEVTARVSNLKSEGLTPDNTAGIRKELYFSLLSTCYVIENLAALMSRSVELAAKVRYSARNLFRVLASADHDLNAVFDPYQQVMLAARSLIAFAVLSQEDIAKLVIPGMLTEIVTRERQQELDRKLQEKRRLQRVIKEWVEFEWAPDEVETLGGGLSGARVVRVRPKLHIPAEAVGGYHVASVPHVESLIIKFARKTDLDRERQNYASIPPEFRRVAASIPSRTHHEIVGDEVIEYLVIEDLAGYRTIQEILPKSTHDFRLFLAKRFADFLKFFYSMPVGHTPVAGMARRLYLTPIYRSIDTVQTLRQRLGKLDELDRGALDHLRLLLDAAKDLDEFPHTVMHGDLNARNLLVHGRSDPGAELHFKLIDLDRFSRTGDMAYDLGEFVADIEQVFLKHHEEASRDLRTMMTLMFEDFATARGDAGFGRRFHIAKARSLLKLAELKARDGLEFAGGNPISNRHAQAAEAESSSIAIRAYELLRIAADGSTEVTQNGGG